MLAEQRDTIGRYELLLELGRGGMAALYLARVVGPAGFTRLFAIKRILPHLAADPVFVDMFLAEGRIAAQLMHPNLCTVWELGQHRGELFLAMDYLDGVAWESLVAAAPRDHRGLALAAGVLAQACDGLHHAHTFRDPSGTALPIVHRDVSPQNLFVSRDGTCRVLDFGVSKIASDPRRTRSGVRKGKLPYMAPEQVRGDPVDARTDLWAIGVLLWEALVGRHLFDRETDFLTYQAITAGDIPSVNADGERYPAAVDHLLARALACDPRRRHPTARELARDLTELAAGVGGAASRDGIAGSLATLCAPQLAARQQAIAAVLARPPVSGASEAADPAAAVDRDAAATVSMAMRRDDVVVVASATHIGARQPRSRRRGPWLVAGLGAVAIAGAVLLARAISAGPPSPPPIAASGPPHVADVRAQRSAAAAPTEPPGVAASPPAASASPARSTDASPAVANPASPTASPPAASRTRVAAPRATVATATGWYAIDSSPYATIFIDDHKVGDTPLYRLRLRAGSHRIRAVLADGRQRSFAVDIAADRETSSGTLAW